MDKSNSGEAAGDDLEKYAPETFEEAAHDLADGCLTLTIVTMNDSFEELLSEWGSATEVQLKNWKGFGLGGKKKKEE